MYCSRCGSSNSNDVLFCSNCGESINKVPIYSQDENLQQNRALNIFQKILLLVFLSWIILGLFYIPYREDGEIIYDTFWADYTNIDWIRALIPFSFLTVVSYIIYKYLFRLNLWEKEKYRKAARRELFVVLSFVLITIIAPTVLCSYNYINRKRENSINKEINLLQHRIAVNQQKRDLKKQNRKQFWDILNPVFDLSYFEGHINRLWDYITSKANNDSSFDKIYNHIITTSEKNDPLKILPHEYAKQQLESLGINSALDLKKFLKNNTLTDEDFALDKEIALIEDKLQELDSKKKELTFFKGSEIVNISLWGLLIIFIIAYILRPLTWLVLGMLKEVKY